MKFENRTPHKVIIIDESCPLEGGGYIVAEFLSEGTIRVSQETKKKGMIGSIPITKTKFGECKNLPEEKADTIYIVSALVCQVCPKRPDFYIPNETVRDEQGRIIGCKSLAKNPFLRI